MQMNDYQAKAMRTASPSSQTILNAALGLNGEAGEIADLLKKHLFQGHSLDTRKFIDEAGDVLWYIALLASALGVSLNEIAKHNIDKLLARYPEGFDANKSRNR